MLPNDVCKNYTQIFDLAEINGIIIIFITTSEQGKPIFLSKEREIISF